MARAASRSTLISDGSVCLDHQFGWTQCLQALTLWRVWSEGTVPLGHALGQLAVRLQGPECIFARIQSQVGPVAFMTRLQSSSVV